MICFYNTRSFWPTAYSPKTNSLYVPYIDNCLDMTRAGTDANGKATPERRVGIARPGTKPEEMNGIAKIDLSTGEMLHFAKSGSPSNGAVLTTAGDLVFHGDLNRRFSAFDAATGKQLWETILTGPVAVSTITYAVNGRQYVSVLTGDGLMGQGLLNQAGIKGIPRNANAVYTFALPGK